MQQKPPEFEASTELASQRAPSRLTFSESWSNDIGLSSCRPEKQARTRQPVRPLRGCAIAFFPNFTAANVRASVGSCPVGPSTQMSGFRRNQDLADRHSTE